MAKGRSRGQKWTQAFFMLSLLLLLMLFTLGILLLSNSTYGSPGSEGFGERVEKWTETLSWEPRVFIYHNFLSKEECEHIISLAKPHMRKSTIVDSKTGRGIESRVRTSYGMFLHRGQDKIIRD
uniref:Prolyl 4-hydroxylase 3 n=1 Tax=Quercus lobata TaxID=97700 RepID=A0A7N2KSV2_QUELO